MNPYGSSVLFPYTKCYQKVTDRVVAPQSQDPSPVFIELWDQPIDLRSQNLMLYNYISSIDALDPTAYFCGTFNSAFNIASDGTITALADAEFGLLSSYGTTLLAYVLSTVGHIRLLMTNPSANPIKVNIISVFQFISA